VAIVALIMGLTVNKVLSGKGQGDPTALIDAGIILLPQSRQLPPVTMTNQDGQPVLVNELKGKWSLLFFGYTFCPDICPTTLAQLRQIKSELPKEAVDKLQVILVSVDPNRDTPTQLKQYLGYFDPQFEGLTGANVDDVQKVSNAVSIPFIPADTTKPNYTVDHSGNLALIGPDGTQRGFIPCAAEQPEAGGAVARAVAAQITGNTKHRWEGACSRWRWVSQRMHRLNCRYRGQPPPTLFDLRCVGGASRIRTPA